MLDENSNNIDAIYELEELIGFDPANIEELLDGGHYLRLGKYALAEPVLIRCIDKLENAFDQLMLNPESALEQMKTTNFDDGKVFAEFCGEIEISLNVARKYLAEVQNKLAEGIKEASLEDRYQDTIRKGKRREFKFYAWTCFIIIATAFFGYLAYIISPWLIPIPIIIGISIYLITLFIISMKSESYINQYDRELIDLMEKRGRLLK